MTVSSIGSTIRCCNNVGSWSSMLCSNSGGPKILSFSYCSCLTLLNTWQQFSILIIVDFLLITLLLQLLLGVINQFMFQERLYGRQFGVQHATH